MMPARSFSRKLLAALSLPAMAVIAGCTATGGLTPSQEADQRALAEARPTGPARSCIPLAQIRQSHVRDERTIDFEMAGGGMVRSRLPYACPSLAFEERFSYATSLSQLCSTDIITVLHSNGQRGASCGLGEFQPIELPRRRQ